VGRIEDVNPSPFAQAGILQHRHPHLLVVPAYQVCGDVVRSGFGLGGIYGLLDGPPRGALAHFDRHTGLLRGPPPRLAQVRLLFHLDQEFAHHITAKEFIVRGATHRQATLRLDDFDTVAQRP
jgi:hypothetical protein